MFTIIQSQDTSTLLRSVDVKSIRKLNDMKVLPSVIAPTHSLEIHTDGRAFLVFDEDVYLDGTHRSGVWLHKNLDVALHKGKAHYLVRHQRRRGLPAHLQIVVAHDDEGERYVSVLFHNMRTDDVLPVYPDLWAGNSDMLELEYWDQEYGYAYQS